MIPIEQLLAMQARAERAEGELAAVRAELAEVKAPLTAGNAQAANLLGQLSRLADRVTELAAAVARGKRGTPPPRPTAPPASLPSLPDNQREAFDNRPRPPVLPEKGKGAPKPRRPAGRNPLPEHLPADVATARPCACGQCGGGRLDVVDTFVEEKLTVIKKHQRRRVVHRATTRCRDCGARTTGEAPPAPFERSKVTCEWLAWFLVQKFLLLTPLDRLLRYLRLQGIDLSMGTAVRLVERAAELLVAFDGEHWKVLRAGSMMQSDGTHFNVVVKGVPGTHRGYLEVYLNGETVVFQCEPEKGAGALVAKLRGFRGLLLADAEHRFNGVYGPKGATEAGCNAHGLR